MEPSKDLACTAGHGFDRDAAITGASERMHVGTDCSCNFLSRDIGLRGCLPQNAGIDHQGVYAMLLQTFTEKGVLDSLGIQCPEKHNTWSHGFSSPDRLCSRRTAQRAPSSSRGLPLGWASCHPRIRGSRPGTPPAETRSRKS